MGLQRVGHDLMIRRRQQHVSLEKIIIILLPVVPVTKNLSANAGDTRNMGSLPGWESFPEERHGNPLQCSYLENPMDRGAWQATVHSAA